MIDLKELSSDELLKLRKNIDVQIKENEILKEDSKKVKDKTKLSGLTKEDKIFFIDFNKGILTNQGFTTISFYKESNTTIYNGWYNFSTGKGMSSAVREELLDNHCFLDIHFNFLTFFTLKPESWREDLKIELDKYIRYERLRHEKEMNRYTEYVETFLLSKDVDTFLEKIK